MELPSTAPGQPQPVWTGSGFRIGNEIFSILDYGYDVRGWSDDLTRFHDETVCSDHSMDIASRRYSFNQIVKHLRTKQPVVLDVGCSAAYMMHARLRDAVVAGADVVSDSLKRLSKHIIRDFSLCGKRFRQGMRR